MSLFQRIKSLFKPAPTPQPPQIDLTPVVEAIRQATAATDARSILLYKAADKLIEQLAEGDHAIATALQQHRELAQRQFDHLVQVEGQVNQSLDKVNDQLTSQAKQVRDMNQSHATDRKDWLKATSNILSKADADRSGFEKTVKQLQKVSEDNKKLHAELCDQKTNLNEILGQARRLAVKSEADMKRLAEHYGEDQEKLAEAHARDRERWLLQMEAGKERELKRQNNIVGGILIAVEKQQELIGSILKALTAPKPQAVSKRRGEVLVREVAQEAQASAPA